MALTKERIAEVKGKGFLINRGTECFSGRLVPRGTVFSAEDLITISELSSKFGSGKVAFTSRQCCEIVGIHSDNIEAAIAYAKERGLAFGGTGAKIRPVTACKGTTCVYGNCDTQKIAAYVYDNYYIGWSGVKLPHKFKIGVGGCPNSCMKPSLNDFGIEGHKVPVVNTDKCRACKVCLVEKSCPSKVAELRDGKINIDTDKCLACGVCVGKCPFGAVENEAETVYRIFVGGTWGKSARMGTPLSRFVSEEEIYPILEKSMLWFKKYGLDKERFGKAIDRVGVDKFEEELFLDNLLDEKDEILSK